MNRRRVLRRSQLMVDTVADFRARLRLVLERAGLTCGQTAATTSIGRSSSYNLVTVRRTRLPTRGDQVQGVPVRMRAAAAPGRHGHADLGDARRRAGQALVRAENAIRAG
jgi:hypothetical protein